MIQNLPYHYGHLSIPGGGYVTGFAYHPKQKNILYCRTDIGGVYRYDYQNSRFVSLIDHVTMNDLSETYASAIALDPADPDILYIACGTWKNRDSGVLAKSADGGKTFTYSAIPCGVHGNFPGRGTGSRLVVDPNNSRILYFASQRGGLLRSQDCGQTWEFLSIESAGVKNECNDTFIFVGPKSVMNGRSSLLVLATAGIQNMTKQKQGFLRGHSLYVSYDAGTTWSPLAMPESKMLPDTEYSGLVGHRYAYDEKYLYVTLSSSGPQSRTKAEGYSCDSGDAAGGRIIRYPFLPDSTLGPYEDITPCGGRFSYRKDGTNGCGFGGISASAAMPGLLAASTLCEHRGDIIFISKDYGTTWEESLYDLTVGGLHFNTSYMKPEYNGSRSLIHWLADIKINPHDPDEVLATSGTGIFASKNFTQQNCSWSDHCTGIEETVHLNVYSPHAGAVIALDMVGDLGGFAFTSLDAPCKNSFADADGNRYITCINADYSDLDPETVIVTARGNWTGKTTGGLILSTDQCRTFTHLPLPYGLSPFTDSLLAHIASPNVNAGWVAISPDCKNIVWSIAKYVFLPVDAVVYSHDGGMTYGLSAFYDLYQKPVHNGNVKVFSDRVYSSVMYGFDTSRIVYISHDGGAHFYQYPVDETVPDFLLSMIDTRDASSICPDHGRSGIFYISMEKEGIWVFQYDRIYDTLSFKKLTNDGDIFYHIGLGVNEGCDFLHADKAVYAAATIEGTYGFYRSTDQCRTWSRINDDAHMYGGINSICGDSRTFGRFYIATGSRGLLYGEPAQ